MEGKVGVNNSNWGEIRGKERPVNMGGKIVGKDRSIGEKVSRSKRCSYVATSRCL